MHPALRFRTPIHVSSLEGPLPPNDPQPTLPTSRPCHFCFEEGQQSVEDPAGDAVLVA